MLFPTATGYALQALAALPDDGTYRLAKHLSEDLLLDGPDGLDGCLMGFPSCGPGKRSLPAGAAR